MALIVIILKKVSLVQKLEGEKVKAAKYRISNGVYKQAFLAPAKFWEDHSSGY